MCRFDAILCCKDHAGVIQVDFAVVIQVDLLARQDRDRLAGLLNAGEELPDVGLLVEVGVGSDDLLALVAALRTVDGRGRRDVAGLGRAGQGCLVASLRLADCF